MYRLKCSEIWGGVEARNEEVATAGVTASLYSSSEHGIKGGDIYYLGVCDSDLLTRIFIADVVGHGDSVSAMSQIVYDSLVKQMNNIEGETLLRELNRNTTKHGVKAMTTAITASYYKANQHFYFASAGHHPFLVNRKDEKEWREIDVNDPTDGPGEINTPLGIFPDSTYTQDSILLNPGDRVLFYTDGVVEASNAQGDAFGLKRLKKIVTRHGAEPINQLKRIILKKLQQHVGFCRQQDDRTLLIICVS